MGQSAVLYKNSMSEEEFREACDKILALRKAVMDNLRSIAELLGRMSKPQLDSVKKMLRGFLRSEHVERLALYGQGKISWHLAVQPKTIPALMLKQMNDSVLQEINDPENAVQVFTSNGQLRTKKIKDLKPEEFSQVIDPQEGILGVDEQNRRLVQKKKESLRPKDPSKEMLFDGLVVSDNRDKVTIYGRYPSDRPNERRIGVQVRMKDIKNLLK